MSNNTKFIDGIEYPRVTYILNTVNKGNQLLFWAASMATRFISEHWGTEMPLNEMLENARRNHILELENAGSIGTQVHSLIFQSAKNNWKFNTKSMRPEVHNAYQGFLKFQEAYKPKFIVDLLEKAVTDKGICVTGSFDTCLEWRGKLWLVDWKTSSAIFPSFSQQISIYRHMLEIQEGIKVHGMAVVRFSKDKEGEFEIKDYSEGYKKYLNSFLRLTDYFYSTNRRLKNNPRARESELALAA